MSNDKPAPKFMKPGDDPELDRMLAEVRAKGSEPPPEYYYDVLGRRRRVPVVDQEAPTLVPNEKGATTAPVVTETRPAAVLPGRQKMWLALGALAILGPVVALALGAFQSGKVPPQGALTVPMSATNATSAATMAVPPVMSAAPAPTMSAVPVIELDAGAAPVVTAIPSAARPAVGPGAPSKTKDDPYDAAAPSPANPVDAAPTPTVVPIAPPASATSMTPSKKILEDRPVF
jgi:hypothetical protein